MEWESYDAMKAQMIYWYFQVYCRYIREFHLVDDSNEISVEELVDFVDNKLDPDLKKEWIAEAKL